MVVNNSGRKHLKLSLYARFHHCIFGSLLKWKADIGPGSQFLRIFRLSVGPLLTPHSPDGPDFFRLSLLLWIFLISFKADHFSSSQALCFQTPKSSVQIHFNLCLMQTSFQHTFELGREFCADNCISEVISKWSNFSGQLRRERVCKIKINTLSGLLKSLQTSVWTLS